MPTVFSC